MLDYRNLLAKDNRETAKERIDVLFFKGRETIAELQLIMFVNCLVKKKRCIACKYFQTLKIYLHVKKRSGNDLFIYKLPA